MKQHLTFKNGILLLTLNSIMNSVQIFVLKKLTFIKCKILKAHSMNYVKAKKSQITHNNNNNNCRSNMAMIFNNFTKDKTKNKKSFKRLEFSWWLVTSSSSWSSLIYYNDGPRQYNLMVLNLKEGKNWSEFINFLVFCFSFFCF